MSHFNPDGDAHMVDVGDKPETTRVAVAAGSVEMSPGTLQKSRKGDVLGVARLAAINAVKRTADLIPLCHPLRVTGVDVELAPTAAGVDIRVTVRAFDRTGVEMEALTGVSVAALTIYDMLKSVDRGMRITDVRLLEKSGGRSGRLVR